MIGFTVSQMRVAALATLLGTSKKSDAALAIRGIGVAIKYGQ